MTKLEHLPNELILEIFTYCYPDDLFISLFNLNARLNSLIYTQPLNIDLSNLSPKYVLGRYYKSVLFHAREQIHALKLSDTYGRMSHFLADDNQILVDFKTRILILSQVKSLILYDLKMTSLNQISKYINNIEHLRVSLIQPSQFTSDYGQELFKSLFAKPWLKKLCLEFYWPIVFEDDIGMSTSLTHVTLSYCLLQDLARLLRQMPNIQKLHITCENPPNIFSDDYNGFDYSSYDGLADCIPYLTELKLKTMHIPFEEVEILLRQLPQLIKLTYSSFIMKNYSNGSIWEHCINNYLPNLQKFSLFIEQSYFPDDILIDLNEIIQSFNSFFWHRWPVVVEYYEETTGKKRLLLYTLPIQLAYLPTYLYGSQILTNIDEDNLNTEKSYYEKLYKLDFIFHENPLSRNLLPKRVYSNLDTLSFSFELINPRSFETDTILIDLQQCFSTSLLSQIKAIYLNDPIYPINFVSNLLKLFPNIKRLKLPASSLDLSITLPRINSLTISVHSTIECNAANILRQIAIHFPNVFCLFFELTNSYDIYILLPYCLRKFSHPYLRVTINELSPCIDQEGFMLWFNDYKQLNGLDDDVQVEFNDDKHSFQMTL